MANVVGGAQSVGSIGCQTTNTRTGRSGCRRKIASTAEDPRRHVAQVGESSTMIRASPAPRLKSARTMSSDPASRLARGGWPGGALCVPSWRSASAISTTATTPIAIHPRRFTGMAYGNQSAIRPARTWGNSATSKTMVPDTARIAIEPPVRVAHPRWART